MSLAEEFIAAFNAHDLDRIGGLLSDTFLVVSPTGPIGPYGWKQTSAEYLRSFPDTKWTKLQLSGDGEGFALQIIWTGTQASPPHHPLHLPITFRARVLRGKIETLHVDYDPAEVERQMGLPPGSLSSPQGPAPTAREDRPIEPHHGPRRDRHSEGAPAESSEADPET